MIKRKSAIAASVKKASRGQATFVFASSMDALPATAADLTATLANAKYAQFGCTACGTSMLSRADTAPFCVTCGAGDGHVHQVKAEAKPDVTANTNLAALTCSVCSSTTVVEESVATAITSAVKGEPTPIHCSCCGNPMIVAAEAEQSGEPGKMGNANISDQTLSTPDAPPKPAVAATDGGDDLEPDDDIDLDNLSSLDADSDEGNDELSVTSDPTTLSTPAGPSQVEQFESPQPEDDALELEPFAIEEDIDTGMGMGMPVSELEEATSPVAETEVLEVAEGEGDPLVDALDMDDTDMALAFVKANNRLVAMKGHMTVATLSPNSKTPNAALIDSKALQAAAFHSVKTEGLRAGLQSLGFTLVKVPITSKTLVERRAQEITAKTAAQETARQKVFAESLAIAAAGLNRGQWKGVENPLRAAMETELVRAGVEQPRRVIARVFESAGVAYAETLLSTSQRLVKMSASARKDLTEILNLTSAVNPEDEHDAESDDTVDQTPVESRFASGGKATASVVQVHKNSSPQSVTAAASILSGKAPLTFNF